MFWRINAIIFLIFSFACTEENSSISRKENPEVSEIKSPFLIEAVDLLDLYQNTKIKVIDMRELDLYMTEHIPDALHISRENIQNDSFPYGGMMANTDQIEELFGDLGIGTSDTLVLYDDKGLCEAARLWWILQNYDFGNVKLLHGGLVAWKDKGGTISSELPSIIQSEFNLPSDPSMRYLVSKEDVQLAISANTLIVDTRSKDEFSGKMKKKGAFKAGRIPNSQNIDWASAINFEGDKKFKTLKDLDSIFDKLKISKKDEVIVYCHSGVRSAHTTFVLTELLGYTNVRNYDGSWIEWSFFENQGF